MQAADPELEAATERHRAGQLAAARELYHALLSRAPANATALYRCGLLELQDGKPAASLTLLEQATLAVPDEPRYQFVLGQALQALGSWEAATAAYEVTLKLQPDFLDAWNSLGMCRQMRGQLPQAAQAYRQALQLEPRNAGVLANLGTVMRERGELAAAVALLREAVLVDPATASHAVNLGIALWSLGEAAEAEQVLGRVLAQHPDNAEAAFNLGNALSRLGKTREAMLRYAQALTLRPGYVDALINLGNAQAEIGDFAAAQASYDAAIEKAPASAVALNNAACLLRTLGHLDEAQSLLEKALGAAPDNAALHDTLGNVHKDAGALDAAIEGFSRALELNPRAASTHSNLAYARSFQSAQPGPVLEECLRWNQRFGAQSACGAAAPADLNPQRRLRIGYVSPDFRIHCQSLFTIPLLSHHDHAAFEIYCYSSVKRTDDCTQRIAGYADHWRDVRTLDDVALCRLILDDRIDILVDLTMHMAGGRPLLFARKPAAVQIAWLAYPGTTGIGAIDYRISDPRLDPPDFDEHYSERTLRLPDCFWCYDPLTAHPEVNPLPALQRGYLTFGCLNNPCKLTDQTLRLWGAVAGDLPTARLRLMAPAGRQRDVLTGRLAAQGIDASRVDYQQFMPRAQYLRSYHDIDIGLDTLPYNGHTTSLDSMWMGVPVVTRVGDTCVGRGGLSQLHQLDLLELAADSDASFRAIIRSFAGDLGRLAHLRQGLRARLAASPLMDGARFAGNLEQLYRGAWRDYCARRPADP